MKKINEITINDLVYELLESDGNKLYAHEQLVLIPVANQAQILERGIRDMATSKNYICAASLLRSLIEVTMVIIYDNSKKEHNVDEYYKKFLENGRLQRYSKSKKCWENVKDEHLIQQFEKSTSIGIRQFYNKMCSVLHFSTEHVKSLTKKSAQGEVTIVVGCDGPDVTKDEYDKLLNHTRVLIDLIKLQIAAAVHQKRLECGDQTSKFAEITLNGRKVEVC